MNYFKNAEKKSIFISVHFLIFIQVFTVSLALLTVILSIAYHYIQSGDFDVKKWIDPMSICLTYNNAYIDKNELWGYCILTLFASAAELQCLLLSVPIFSFFYSTCLFLKACCHNCMLLYNEIDELTSERNELKDIVIKKRLCKIVQLEIEMQR